MSADAIKAADTALTASALNRIADALFTQAKSMSRSAKVAEAQLECTRQMVALQAQNVATSRALEESLTNPHIRPSAGE